jgi:[ribosomal protein S5]-alanine N-acetyltransferase
MTTIKGKGFLIRYYRKGDESSLVRHLHNRKIYNMTMRIPYPYTQRDAEHWVSRNLQYPKKPQKINFVIDINGEVVGGVGLFEIIKHKAEIGYWLSEKYWGKGIMTEAVGLIARYAFSKLGLVRLTAKAFAHNKASQRVLEKNGFVSEGMSKKFYLKDGNYIDAVRYAIVR